MNAINCQTFYRYHRIYDMNDDLNYILYDAEVDEILKPICPGFEMHLVLVPRMSLEFMYKPYSKYMGSANNIYYRGYLIKKNDKEKRFYVYKVEDEEQMWPEDQDFESNEMAMLYIDVQYLKAITETTEKVEDDMKPSLKDTLEQIKQSAENTKANMERALAIGQEILAMELPEDDEGEEV